MTLPDVQESPLLKQMQAADSGEAEMETESPGGISENLLVQSKPLSSFLDFILSLLPSPSVPVALTAILVGKDRSLLSPQCLSGFLPSAWFFYFVWVF